MDGASDGVGLRVGGDGESQGAAGDQGCVVSQV